MNKITLRPYPGEIRLCRTRSEFQREHKKLFGEPDDGLGDGNCGRMVGQYNVADEMPVYLVWAKSTPYLAHELSHVILHVFELAGIDPREANGEPFCYMLSQLMLDAGL